MALRSIQVVFRVPELGTGGQTEVQVLNAPINFDLPTGKNVLIKNIRGACFYLTNPTAVSANESQAGRPWFAIRFGLRRDFEFYQESPGIINYAGTGLNSLGSASGEYQLAQNAPNIENLNFLGTGISIYQAGYTMSNTPGSPTFEFQFVVTIEFENC